MADSQKTEKATPKKRRDERKKGNVFMSNDAVSVAVLIVGVAVLALSAPRAGEEIGRFFRMCISMAGSEKGGELSGTGQLTGQFLKALAWSAGPLLGASTVAGIAATFLQTRMLVAGEALRPKFSRIDPIQGFRRLFSMRSLIEALKGVLKILALLYLIYSFLKGVVNTFPKLMFTDVFTGGAYLMDLAVQMAIRIVVAYAVLAAADFLYQWWDYERQLRMSKQEIKVNCSPSRGQRKNIKFSRPAAKCCWPLFMQQSTTCVFLSVSARPSYAGLFWCCNNGCSTQSFARVPVCW